MQQLSRILLAVGILAILSSFTGYTAANTVPSGRLTDQSQSISLNDTKPDECNSLTLTAILINSGSFNGTTADEVLLGGSLAQTIDGKAGNDCIMAGGGTDTVGGSGGDDIILGGDGDDNLTGDQNNDTLYGGNGNDTIDGGNGTDTCIGGPGTNTYLNCETTI